MSYALVLLTFGLAPIALLWIADPALIRRHAGSLVVIVLLIMAVSIPWEMMAVGRVWYYSPSILWGPRLLNLPVEEIAFFAIDGLLVGTLALKLRKEFHGEP